MFNNICFEGTINAKPGVVFLNSSSEKAVKFFEHNTQLNI